MPPPCIREGMVQDLLDFICEAVPRTYEASIELISLILESDPATSSVAQSHPRWIQINLMRQLLPLSEAERQDWIIDLFSGRENTAQYFAETMLDSGIWREDEDEDGFYYTLHRLKEVNFRTWLLRPEIQEIYDNEVMPFLPDIPKESIEGSDYILRPKKNSKPAYKVVVPNWQEEVVALKNQLAQSDALIEELRVGIQEANVIIATQANALKSRDKQLKVARETNARSEKAWLRRYKKFFKRSWKQ